MRAMLALLVAVAALGLAPAARADLVYEFHFAPDQNDITNMQGAGTPTNPVPGPGPLVGTPGSPLMLQPNTPYIMQVVLHQNADPGPSFANVNGDRMIGYGFRMNYLPSVFFHAPLISNFGVNTVGTALAGFSGEPLLNGSTATGTNVVDVTLGPGLYQASGNYVLTNLRFLTGAGGGAGTLSIARIGPGAYFNGTDNADFDDQIFDQPFNLSVQVVPEPSSFVLIGAPLAIAAWRRRRS